MGVIGIDISDRSIKIIQLDQSRKRPLQAYCWKKVPPGAIVSGVIQDTKAVSTVVKTALTECRIKPRVRNPIVASIPESESFLRVVEIPPMSEAEVAEAVQWEVAQHIPFGLENVYLDWQPVEQQSSHAAEREVLVGAAEKAVVDPLAAVLQGLGLDVAALELESQAIARALISADMRRKAGLLVLDIGADATNVVIHDHGTIRFTATLQYGGERLLEPLSEEQRQQFMKSERGDEVEGMKETIAPKLDELVAEIHSIVEYYGSQVKDHHVREIVFTGGGANITGIGEAMLRFFDNVHLQRGNPWANVFATKRVARSPIRLEEAVHYSTAFGLALRPVVSTAPEV